MTFDYAEPLAKGMQITWKNKSLWLYGGLPLLVFVFEIPMFLQLFPLSWSPAEMAEAEARLNEGTFLAGFFATNLLITLVSATLQMFGSTAMTLGVIRGDQGAGKQGFIELLKDGLPFVGRVMGAVTVVLLAAILVMIVFTACGFAVGAATLGIGALLLQFASYPILAAIWIVAELAQIAVVADGFGVMDSVERAWDVFRTHIWKFILIGIAVYAATSMLSGLFVMPLIMPIWMTMMQGVMTETAASEDMVRAVTIWTILFFPVYAIFYGVVLTYTRAAFAVAYLRLTQNPEARQEFLGAAAA